MIVSTLERLVGSPARIVLPYEGASERRTGILGAVEEMELAVDLMDLPNQWAETGTLAAEVMHSEGIFRFSTQWWATPANPRRLMASLPDRIELIQRRRSPRISITHPILVQRVGSTPVQGSSLNLSVTGIAFSAPFSASVGEQVEIRLSPLADGGMPPLVAHIIRRGPGPSANSPTYGAHFAQLSEEMVVALRTHIAALSAANYA